MNIKQKKILGRIILSLILLITSIILGFHDRTDSTALILYLVIYMLIGYDILLKSLRNISHGRIFDENFLMAIATIGAFIIKDYPEAVAVMLFYQTGEFFQTYAVEKSRESVTKLMNIRPDYANVERDGQLLQLDPDEVSIGDIIIIKPGEKIPLDGLVIEGSSSVNSSALTGESRPVDVSKGSQVISGCININGLLKVKTTKDFEDSTVSKILDLVENASSKKGTTERFVTRFAKYYTPFVVIFATLLFLVPVLFFNKDWQPWLHRSLVLLVISCPCALVISIPMSFFGGIGGASREGILIKGGNYLEILSKIDTIVFDKTGTLTKGNFKVIAIHPSESYDIEPEKLLEFAAYAEAYSNHPISESLRLAYGKDISLDRIKEHNDIPGHGIIATIDDSIVACGNGKLMNQLNIRSEKCTLSGTVVDITIDNFYAGHIIIGDEIKENSLSALSSLKQLGIKNLIMLTGDSKSVGEAVAHELGIDKVYTELLPGDKVDIVEQLQAEMSEDGKLAFVGDGINDAPVLSIADVGIAMGALGSDAAIEAADIVLMDDDPEKIPDAYNISKKTLNIVWQNIVLSLSVKIVALILGALSLVGMKTAIFADVGITLLATANAFRALNPKSRK